MSQKRSKKEKRRAYYPLDKGLAKVKGLSSSAKILAAILREHYNPIKGCFPSHSLLSKESGLSLKVISVQLQRLRKAGIIAWTLDKKNRNTRLYEGVLFTEDKDLWRAVLQRKELKSKRLESKRLESKRLVDSSRNDLSLKSKRLVASAKKPSENSKDKELQETTTAPNELSTEPREQQQGEAVAFSLQIQSQIQKQKLSLQNTLKEWKVFSERLGEFKLLEVLLWIGEIKRRIGEGYNIENAAGYLFNSLRDKKREPTNRQEKVRELLDKFIPTVRIYEIPSAPKDKEKDTDFRYEFRIEAEDLEQQEKDVKRLEENLGMNITEIARRAKTNKKVKRRMDYYLYENAVWSKYFEEGWFEQWREKKEKVGQLREEPEKFFESIKEEILVK